MRFFRMMNLHVRHDFCFIRKQFLISQAGLVFFFGPANIYSGRRKGFVKLLWKGMEVPAAVVRAWWYLRIR